MLNEMGTFIAVAEELSFTKAAERLSLSQPTVSMHIKNLENFFQTTLVKRSIKQKNITITPMGRMVYNRVKQINNLIDLTHEEVANYTKNLTGELHIGATFTIGEYFLPKILSSFNKTYPQLKLKVSIVNTVGICQKLSDLQIDIGLVEGEFGQQDFESGVFYKDRLVLATAYNHSLSKRKFNCQEWEKQTWVTREPGSGSRQQLDEFLLKNKMKPENLVLFSSNFAVKEAVKYNLGVTLISEYIARDGEKKKELTIVSSLEEYSRTFKYILPGNMERNQRIKEFIKYLEQV